MIPIRWSQQAVRDLESIHRFIACDSGAYSRRVVQSLLLSVEQLAEFPHSGRLVPEYQGCELRELIRPPYRIVYRLIQERIEIITVFHSSRLPPLPNPP